MFDKTIHYDIIWKICTNVLHELGCDFVGFAFQNMNSPDIQWHIATGNKNDKYKRITVRYGKGIAGRVISTGTPITIEDFPQEIIGKALEYPIMLAEKLLYSFAVPIQLNGISKGVLLVGQRTNKPLTEPQKKAVLRAARMIEELIRN